MVTNERMMMFGKWLIFFPLHQNYTFIVTENCNLLLLLLHDVQCVNILVWTRGVFISANSPKPTIPDKWTILKYQISRRVLTRVLTETRQDRKQSRVDVILNMLDCNSSGRRNWVSDTGLEAFLTQKVRDPYSKGHKHLKLTSLAAFRRKKKSGHLWTVPTDYRVPERNYF